jgi:hypothetical protein
MPLVRVLFRLRSFPALVARRKGLPQAKHEPLLSQTVDFGFTVLGHDPGREIVAGAVAQIWKRGGRAAVIGDGAEFAAFDNPGYVKVATNFLLTHQDGGTRIETETRVLATDPESRRRFARYWRLIRPGSGAIRRDWLRAIARRAERSAGRPRNGSCSVACRARPVECQKPSRTATIRCTARGRGKDPVGALPDGNDPPVREKRAAVPTVDHDRPTVEIRSAPSRGL